MLPAWVDPALAHCGERPAGGQEALADCNWERRAASRPPPPCLPPAAHAQHWLPLVIFELVGSGPVAGQPQAVRMSAWL